MAHTNPFRPQNPINRGMFVGRKPEIRRLESVLNQAKSEQPTNFMITGERGIGKTSLMMYLGAVAQSHGDFDEEQYNFLIADIGIGQNTTQIDLVRKIEHELKRELARRGVKVKKLEDIWDFLKRIEVAGFRIDTSQSSETGESLLVEHFGHSLVELVQEVCRPGEPDGLLGPANFDGILILIDEADQASSDLDLGSFLKSLTEFVGKNGCKQITIGLSGLERLSEVLTASHPSSLRVFEEIPLKRLTAVEANDLIDTCLDRGDDRLAHGIDAKARKLLNDFAEGHPHFLHQFGFSAFNAAVHDPSARIVSTQEELHFNDEAPDLSIEVRQEEVDDAIAIAFNHVMRGALDSRGALETIGDIYFRDIYEFLAEDDLKMKIILYLCDQDGASLEIDEIAGGIDESISAVQSSLADLATGEHIFHDRFSNNYRIRFSCFGRWVELKTKSVTLSGNNVSHT